jgi:MFS family permease
MQMNGKRRSWSLTSSVLVSERVALVLGIVTVGVLVALFGRYGYDDPYITFRYARNLLEGNGFVYNVGQRTLSTTAPLYGLLLAVMGLAWPDLPSLASSLSALALVLAAALLVLQARAHNEMPVGLAGGLFLSIAPLAVTTFGSESCLYVASVLAGLYAYDRSRLEVAAVTLAAAAMIRPDGLLAAAVLAAYHLFSRRIVPWRPVILYLALTGIWFSGLWLYYGSPIPVTLLAKQQQGLMAISPSFPERFVTLVRNYLRMPFVWVHFALALVGLAQIARKAHHWLPLLTWTAAYFLAYSMLGVSAYFWYYTPLLPAMVILVAEGLRALARLLARVVSRELVVVGTGLLIIVLLSPLLGVTLRAAWSPDSRQPLYREIGEWLDQNTDINATVGTLEVGIIGYYADRTMLDFAGLIQPDVAQQLGKTTSYAEPTVWAIQTMAPDYVILHRDAFADVTKSDWFAASYEPVRDFSGEQTLWMTVYRAREGQ